MFIIFLLLIKLRHVLNAPITGTCVPSLKQRECRIYVTGHPFFFQLLVCRCPGGTFSLMLFVLRCIVTVKPIIIRTHKCVLRLYCRWFSPPVFAGQIKKDVQVAGCLIFANVEFREDTHPECPQRRLNSLCWESVSAVSGAEIPAAPSASLSIIDVLL